MKLVDLPWGDLTLGRVVEVRSPIECFRGHISRLDEPGRVWITWDDGNVGEYALGVLPHVELVDEQRETMILDTQRIMSDRQFVDAEGE